MNNKRELFIFPKGIPGFENHKEYYLIRDQESALGQLLCVEDDNIGFILIPPQIFFNDYSFEVDDESKNIINKLTEESQIEVWTILTNDSDLTKVSINLRAPILLNLDKKIGLQVILSDDKYSARQPLPLNQNLQEGAVK